MGHAGQDAEGVWVIVSATVLGLRHRVQENVLAFVETAELEARALPK